MNFLQACTTKKCPMLQQLSQKRASLVAVARYITIICTIGQGWPTFCKSCTKFFQTWVPMRHTIIGHFLKRCYFTSFVICMVILLNANGISGKAANKRHVYLLLNASLFCFHEFLMFGVKSFTESRREFFKFESVSLKGATSFCCQSISCTKMLVRMPTSFLTAYIALSEFFSSGKFLQCKDRQKVITSEAPESKQSLLSFVFIFWIQWVPFVCYSAGFSKIQSSSYSKITNDLQDFQVSLAMTWSFQFIFSVAIISSTFNLLHFVTARLTVLKSTWMQWYHLLKFLLFIWCFVDGAVQLQWFCSATTEFVQCVFSFHAFCFVLWMCSLQLFCTPCTW